MYFKRLEMVGFKSFAEKTKIKFEPGVTAIVGPNGCGKSNIADAVKWVLGEQSIKELRGSKMEDVIFNGTSNREPINMAEVSLILSNKDKKLPIDYEEVTVARRLFRSGESEYLINKMPVRLKDINDLLAGTGIGTSSYSIIEQGQIGQILSSKPEDRRYIFEEASGITKYKMKKKEALRKLEHTENNLIRLNDIIAEVERQIKSIERQAKKAEKYKQDFDVLKDLELKHSSFKYRNINNESKALSLEHADLKKREEEILSSYNVLSEELSHSKGILERINEELQRTRQEIQEMAVSIDKKTYTINLNTERISELKTLAENLKEELNLAGAKLEQKLKDKESYKGEALSISRIQTEKNNLLSQCEKRMGSIVKEIESLQAKIKSAKEKIFDHVTLETKVKNELIKLGADVQNRSVRLRRLKIEKEKVASEKKELEERSNALENEYNTIKDDVEKNKSDILTLKGTINKLEDSIKLRWDTISESRKSYEATKSKTELLKELEQKQEGFDKCVKAIKEFAPGIQTVADSIKIESGFEKALESALGDLAQVLIVEEKEKAKEVISLINERKLGRASFLICEEAKRIKPKMPKPLSKDTHPVIEHIKYDKNLEDVFLCLLGKVYVAGSSEDAWDMHTRFKDCTFVTQEGYLVEGPRILGGAVIESETSIIGRVEKIKRLEEDLSAIEKNLENEILAKKTDESDLDNLKVKINQAEDVLKNREAAFAKVNAERGSLLNGLKKLDDEEGVLNTEIEDVTKSTEVLTKRGEDLNLNLNRTEEESSRTQQLIKESEDAIHKNSDLREKTLIEIANIKGELSSIKVSYDNISLNLKGKEEECRDIENETASKTNQMESSLKRADFLTKEIDEFQAEIAELEEKKKIAEGAFSHLTEKSKIEIGKFNKKEAASKDKQKELEMVRDNIRDLEVKLTEINYKKNSLLERMQHDYKVDISEVSCEIDEGTDWDEISERIEELKDKLQNMGPVNLVAIEEHKELEDRYNFLTRQKDDLVNAKESLHKAIIKINATTRKMFIETFQKVQVEFKNYFRMLFGGGHAEVFLLDDRDVLESGIEIAVRPPGKKLQNIMLLSGGEKTLTAIALLFSLFRVNPSPFCVLDEIDAALDESNIDRFTRVLQEFVKMSQFILITHSKKTLQIADVLYGITMAEKGISKIISVKFSDKEDEEKDKEEVMV